MRRRCRSACGALAVVGLCVVHVGIAAEGEGSATGATPAAPTAPPLAPVTVTGSRGSGVLGERVRPEEAPVDLRVIPVAVLREPGNASLASVLARDAAVGENYAITGYYQNFTIRGFTLDLGSAYRINGFVVPGEFDIPLDNMDSVQVLEGIAGLQGGTVGAGGTINFVTRRPGAPSSVRAEVGTGGGRRISIDASGPSSPPSGFSFLVHATHADLRPDAPQADGRRDLLAFAADLRLAAGVLLQADVIAQRHAQPAVPGFQLLGGTILPDLSLRDVNINRQPWSRPVTNRGAMASLRLDWQLSETLRLEAGAARTVARIDDNLATPTGCNAAPVQYFCANGDYVLYDYHARERRSGDHLMAALHALANTGPIQHAFTAGAERIGRSIRQNDLSAATIYDADGNALSGNLDRTELALPAPVGSGVDLPRRSATQTALFVSDRLSLGRFDLLGAARWVEIAQKPEAVRERQLLPQLAASWRFAEGQRLYVSGARSLEFGSAAPLTATNAGELLPPRAARQEELGWKVATASGASWSVVAFRMRRPYEFTLPEGSSYAGLGDTVSRGRQTHTGLSIAGETAPRAPLRLEGSLTLLRARASGSGIAGYDDVQVQNVPRLSSTLRATWALPSAPLELGLAWTERSRRNARRDGAASVPGYAVFDAGASWRGTVGGRPASLAVALRNFTDHRYWRDAGEAYSADLLFPGAGRSLAVSAGLDF